MLVKPYKTTSSPWTVKLSCQHSYISKLMTNKPDWPICGLWSHIISTSVHAGLQVSMCSGYDSCCPG